MVVHRESPAALYSDNSVVVKVIHGERTKIQENDFRYENGASLRRITPSTQVGRLSGSHSDIGLLLTQFPR